MLRINTCDRDGEIRAHVEETNPHSKPTAFKHGFCKSDPIVPSFSAVTGADGHQINVCQGAEDHSRRRSSINAIVNPFQLYERYSPSSEILVEMIFIHGLNGNSEQAWSSPRAGHAFWPDWLTKDPDFKHVRLFTYDYKSNWKTLRWDRGIETIGKEFLHSLHERLATKNAQSKIVIVAHSMGGLVTSAAITHAFENRQYRDFANRFKSVFFFGTPHGGVLESPTTILGALAWFFEDLAWLCGKKCLEELLSDSEFLSKQKLRYVQAHEGLKLSSHCFYETNKTSILFRRNPLRILLVPQKSATLDGSTPK